MEWSSTNPKPSKEKWPKVPKIQLCSRVFAQRKPLKSTCHVRSKIAAFQNWKYLPSQSREASHSRLSREARGQRNHSISYYKFDNSSLLSRFFLASRKHAFHPATQSSPSESWKNKHSRFARDSFSQRRLNFLSCNSSKTTLKLDLACQKCVLNRVVAVPQTLITQCSKKRKKPTQNEHKTIKTTQTHEDTTKHNKNINTHKVGDFTTKTTEKASKIDIKITSILHLTAGWFGSVFMIKLRVWRWNQPIESWMGWVTG